MKAKSILIIIFIFIISFLNVPQCFSQSGVSINSGGTASDSSAMLDISSSSKGLLIPRVALTSADDLTTVLNPATSLLVFNTNASMVNGAVGFWYFSGTKWEQLTGGAQGLPGPTGPPGGWELTGNAGTVDNTNFIGTTDTIPFNIRVNNRKAGKIAYDINSGELTLGYQAGISNKGNRNTFIGYQSGFTNTTGQLNTAVGYFAMYLNKTGYYNSAFGQQTLRNNATGTHNTALGMEALIYNTTGSYNTSVGTFSLYGNNTGSYNAAVGDYALFQTGASYNTGMGYQAGYANTYGTYNTFLGYNADVSANNFTNAMALGNGAIASASNLVVLGNSAVTGFKVGKGSLATSSSSPNMYYDNTTGLIYRSTASLGASGWSLTGNTGTVDGTSFLGTKDNVPFTLKVNNQLAGRVDHLMNNTFLGYQAGTVASGNYNTLLGCLSGSSQTTATENVFVGSGSGYYLESGSSNTAVGYNAMYCYGASGNVSRPGGTGNVAIGKWAMFNPYQGDYNVAMGFSAFSLPHTGSENVYIGNYSDAAFGYDPSYSTAIGSRASANGNNSTAIGYRAYANVANTLILGSISGTNGATSGVNVGIGTTSPDNLLSVNGSADKPGGGIWGTFSDSRVKKEVSKFNDGMNIIRQINPVTFKYNGLAGYNDDGKQYVGIIAQDIQKIAPYMIEKKKKKLHESDSATTDLLMFDGSALSYILVNAAKEQQNIIDSLQAENNAIHKEVNDLKTANLIQQTINSSLQAEIEKINQQIGLQAKK